MKVIIKLYLIWAKQMEKNYITKNGYIKLQEQLNLLVTQERPKLVQIINWAASNGDRSENGDYIYGKRKLREVDKQIHLLTKRLENAEVIEYSVHKGKDIIFFGATVTILRQHISQQVVTIVGQDEIEPELNHISWTSPLAKLLLRKLIGDKFVMYLPDNKQETIEIIDVEYI
jgi:transcription elongation factor GreB